MFATWPRYQSVTWLCGWVPLILSPHPARFGVHRPYITGNNSVCSVSSNSNSNSDSSAEVPMPRFTNKRNQQNHIESHFNIENCFKNLKSVITDEFESLKKYFWKEVIIFKNELLQSSIAKTPEDHSGRSIGHLESQILFLQRELKETDQLVNSLLDHISKCNDIIKTNQELSKNNVNPFEKKN